MNLPFQWFIPLHEHLATLWVANGTHWANHFLLCPIQTSGTLGDFFAIREAKNRSSNADQMTISKGNGVGASTKPATVP